MVFRSKLFLVAVGFVFLAGNSLRCNSAFAQTITKDNNTNNLNLGTSWVGGIAPGASNTALWNNTLPGANTSSLGASQSWGGIQITNPGGAVTIGTGTTSSLDLFTLTLGSGGIDMSTATQNASINSRISASAAQTWSVNGGRTLNMWTVNANRGMSGSGNVTLSRTGTGTATVIMLPGQSGSVGFNDSNSSNGYSGNWTINDGVELQNIRNGRTAWGTGIINLSGGTIAQVQGNWTWTNNISLTTATSSTIGNRSSASANRYLKLQGAISGSGNVTFTDLASTMTNPDFGIILTGVNTMNGNVTISSGAEVRVGGVGGDSTSTDAGTAGSLGTATVLNNGNLTFSRSDTHTVSNDISGSGAVRIGGAVTGSIATQVVTLSGTNIYSGRTEIYKGVLAVNSIASRLGTGEVEFNAASADSGTLRYTGSGAETTTKTLWSDNAGTTATIEVVNAGATLTWNPAGGTRNQNFVKSGAGTLVMGGAYSGAATLTVAGGNLTLTGANTHSGLNTINATGVLQVGNGGTVGTLGGGGVNNNGSLVFTRSDTITIANTISGLGSLTHNGTGTTFLTSATSYSGPTFVNFGNLLVDNTHSGTGTFTVAANASLGGTGSVAGGVNVLAGGNLNPGSLAIGTFTINGPVDLDGTLNVQLDGTGAGLADLLMVNGALDITNATVNFSVLGPLDDSSYVFASYSSLIGGSFATVQSLPSGYILNYAFGGNNIALVAVPEPSALAVGALALIGMVSMRRRREI